MANCVRNPRNTKNIELLQKYKLKLHEKMLLNSRLKIEHLNKLLKDNRQISIRYDKNVNSYKTFLMMALFKISFSKAGKL